MHEPAAVDRLSADARGAQPGTTRSGVRGDAGVGGTACGIFLIRTMSVHRYTLSDANAAAAACAHHIVTRLEEVLAGKDAVTLAVSGGSTPKLMFGHLSTAKVEWNRVHIFWVDERCVDPMDDQSNYKLALE